MAALTRKTRLLFIARLAFAWGAAYFVCWTVISSMSRRGWGTFPNWLFELGLLIVLASAVAVACSHLRRVRLAVGEPDSASLGTRHQRDFELPMEAEEAYSLIEATIRELPRAESIIGERATLQVHARILRLPFSIWASSSGSQPTRDNVSATVSPGEATSRITVVCEPAIGAWADWFVLDYGANLDNMAAITRAITRRLAGRIHQQREVAKQAATEKALAVAKLSLLEAQVEPHFLYNTLASAQVLTRTDPARADLMLGHLIAYLRRALPRTDDAPSTLGEELERAQSYLEILKIRMGERLRLQVDVPEDLKATAIPAMMLQTLVENAIKHGLEPVPGGGTVWIIARARGADVSVTVADDGRGFGGESGGTGIGLKNVRERLRLAYGERATFAITSNFPKGVAATITLPAAPKG